MSMPDTGWHWEQGTKYTIEGIKALLAINGGAAVALLAFAGNFAKGGGDPASTASSLGWSLLSFGLGALTATIAFVCAYETQLQYGILWTPDDKVKPGGKEKAAKWAPRLHHFTRAVVAVSIICFVVGLCFARGALLASLAH